ncbi:MAG: GTPase Era [Sandaracinaceae bacterium]
MSESESEAEPRAGRVAIVGRPNVGKSTLLNALLGQKLAITTPRPGTTRACLLGVHWSDDPPTQIAFVDTPGLERPRSVLGRVLVEEAQGALEGADAILVLVDATHRGPGDDPLPEEDVAIVEQAKEIGRPIVLGLNKVDKVKDKGRLLPKLAAWSERFDFASIVPISALREDNLAPLLKELRALLPEGLLYAPDMLTDRPERFFVAELVRESIIVKTRQEIPYSVAVQVDEYSEDGNLVRIGATIFVDRKTHKGILIGKGGQMLKDIGTRARLAMEDHLQRKVFLQLFVRVEEGWTRDPQKVRTLTKEAD